MTGFSSEWLALREPHDLRARNPVLIEAVSTFLEARTSVQIVDLACGTGSTLRALSPLLQMQQNWKLVDNDLSLLATATGRVLAKNTTLAAVPLDLNRDLEAVLDGFVDLVATSALLDLISEIWLDRLVSEMAARSIPLYAALSYDGRIAFTPQDPLDVAITAAVNAHQLTDKGFGPALGPAAAVLAVARFESLGYSVVHGTSDWVIGPDAHDMQNELLAGWANAIQEIEALPRADIAAWLAHRRDFVAAGRSVVRVGHIDFFATPSATR